MSQQVLDIRCQHSCQCGAWIIIRYDNSTPVDVVRAANKVTRETNYARFMNKSKNAARLRYSQASLDHLPRPSHTIYDLLQKQDFTCLVDFRHVMLFELSSIITLNTASAVQVLSVTTKRSREHTFEEGQTAKGLPKFRINRLNHGIHCIACVYRIIRDIKVPNNKVSSSPKCKQQLPSFTRRTKAAKDVTAIKARHQYRKPGIFTRNCE